MKEVGTKILIYDNQYAYFELLKTTFTGQYQFILFEAGKPESTDSEFDMIMFFIHDELELLDFVKLCKEDICVVLGLYGSNKPANFPNQGNIHYLNLNKLKNDIIEDVTLFLNMLQEKI